MKVLAEHREVLTEAYLGRPISHRLAPVVDELGGEGLVAWVITIEAGQLVCLSPTGWQAARMLLGGGQRGAA